MTLLLLLHIASLLRVSLLLHVHHLRLVVRSLAAAELGINLLMLEVRRLRGGTLLVAIDGRVRVVHHLRMRML